MRISWMSMTSRICTSVLLLDGSSTARWPVAFNTEEKKSNSISDLAKKVL